MSGRHKIKYPSKIMAEIARLEQMVHDVDRLAHSLEAELATLKRHAAAEFENYEPIKLGTIREVMEVTASFYGVTYRDMISNDRGRWIAHPRQMAMALAGCMTVGSTTQIGRMFHRDHTTVMYAKKVVQERIDADADAAADWSALTDVIRQLTAGATA